MNFGMLKVKSLNFWFVNINYIYFIMQFIKPSIPKFIAFFLALQMLNMSIGTQNIQTDNGKGDNGFKYIDTYTEYLAELIMETGKAFPEKSTRDEKQLHQHRHHIICQQTEFSNAQHLFYFKTNLGQIYHFNNYAYQFVKEISPPPKFTS